MRSSGNVATTCFTEIAEVARRKMLYFRFVRIRSNVSVFVLYLLYLITIGHKYCVKLRSKLHVCQ